MEKALRAIIDARYDRCVSRVIYRLRRVSAKGWAGDDSPMRNLWDHWKREMQEEHSFFHELIEDMVELEVHWIVDRLTHEDGALLTLGTNWLDEEPTEPVFAPQAVRAELMQRVNYRAINEPHRREVQRLLDDQSRRPARTGYGALPLNGR